MKSFQYYTPVLILMAALLALNACSKKAPEQAPQPAPKQAEATAETPKPAQEDTPTETAAKDNLPDQAPDNIEAAKQIENPTTTIDDDLKLDQNCVVTLCNRSNESDCETEAILAAGLTLGDKVKNRPVYVVSDTHRNPRNCEDQGWFPVKCFISQHNYIRYIIDDQLICDYNESNNKLNCIYDDDEKCRPKNLKFTLPKLPNGDKADDDMTIDELEAKYISFWGEITECDSDSDSTYSCDSFKSMGCHCNNNDDCYCPNGNPVTAGVFPDDSCTKIVCNPSNPEDCREVTAACPDIEPAEDGENKGCPRYSVPGEKGCMCGGVPIDIDHYTCEPGKNGRLLQVCAEPESTCICNDIEECDPLAVCENGQCVDRATLRPLPDGYRFSHGLLRCNNPEGCACGRNQCEFNKYCMNGLCFRDPFTKKIGGKIYYYRFIRSYDSIDDAIAQSILYEDDNKRMRDFEKEIKQYNKRIIISRLNDQKRDMTIAEFLKTCGGNTIPKDVATKYCYIRLVQEQGEDGKYIFYFSGWQDDDYWQKTHNADFDWEPDIERAQG